MWNPTHVEVTVSRAKNLKAKGKSGTNDAYVTIKLGKEKFQTTLRERAKDPEWHEQCQFSLSEEHSVVKLKVFHRNLIGKDDFLGYVEIPLDTSLVYERPQSRWYNLGNKPDDKAPQKYRGEIEVFITYVVESISGSHMSLKMTEQSKKRVLLKGLTKPFDKINKKGSLKRTHGPISESSFDLRSTDADYVQSGSNLPPPFRKSSQDSTITGSVEEEVDPESDHRVLKDEKHPHSKSSVFKFPFRSKNKRLQKMSLLSQSTLGLPTSGNEFGPVQEVSLHPPSESSSGFGSRRVSGSESQSSGAESFTQAKELNPSDGTPIASENPAVSPEIKEVSDHLPGLVEQTEHLPETDEDAWHLSSENQTLSSAVLGNKALEDSSAMEFSSLEAESEVKPHPQVEKQQTVAIESLNTILYGGGENETDDGFGLSSGAVVIRKDKEETSSLDLGDVDELIFGKRKSATTNVKEVSSAEDDFRNVFDGDDFSKVFPVSSMEMPTKFNVGTDGSLWSEVSDAEGKTLKDSFGASGDKLDSTGSTVVNNLAWDMSFGVDDTYDREQEWIEKTNGDIWGSAELNLGEEVGHFEDANETVMNRPRDGAFHEEVASTDEENDAFRVHVNKSKDLHSDHMHEQQSETSAKQLDSAISAVDLLTDANEFHDISALSFSNVNSSGINSSGLVSETNPYSFGSDNFHDDSSFLRNVLEQPIEISTRTENWNQFDTLISSGTLNEDGLVEISYTEKSNDYQSGNDLNTVNLKENILENREMSKIVHGSNDLFGESLSGLQRASDDILSLMMDPIGDPIPTQNSIDLGDRDFLTQDVREELSTRETIVDESDIFGDTSSWAVAFNDDAVNYGDSNMSQGATLSETAFDEVSDKDDVSQHQLFEDTSKHSLNKLFHVSPSLSNNSETTLISDESANFFQAGDDFSGSDPDGIKIASVQHGGTLNAEESVSFVENDFSTDMSFETVKMESEVCIINEDALFRTDSSDKQNTSSNIFDTFDDPRSEQQTENSSQSVEFLDNNDLMGRKVVLTALSSQTDDGDDTLDDALGKQSDVFLGGYVNQSSPVTEFDVLTEESSATKLNKEDMFYFLENQAECKDPSESEVKLSDGGTGLSLDVFEPQEKTLPSDDEADLLSGNDNNEKVSVSAAAQKNPDDTLADGQDNVEISAGNLKSEVDFNTEFLEVSSRNNQLESEEDHFINNSFVTGEVAFDFGRIDGIRNGLKDGDVWGESKIHHSDTGADLFGDSGFGEHVEPPISVFGDDFLGEPSIKVLQNEMNVKDAQAKPEDVLDDLFILHKNSPDLSTPEVDLSVNDAQRFPPKDETLGGRNSENPGASVLGSPADITDLRWNLLSVDANETLRGNNKDIDFERKNDLFLISKENAENLLSSNDNGFPFEQSKPVGLYSNDEIVNSEAVLGDNQQNLNAFDGDGVVDDGKQLDKEPFSDDFSGLDSFEIGITNTTVSVDSNSRGENEIVSVTAVDSTVHDFVNVENSSDAKSRVAFTDVELFENLVESSVVNNSHNQLMKGNFLGDENILTTSKFDVSSTPNDSKFSSFTETMDLNAPNYIPSNKMQETLSDDVLGVSDGRIDFSIDFHNSASESRDHFTLSDDLIRSNDVIEKDQNEILNTFKDIQYSTELWDIVPEKSTPDKIQGFHEFENKLATDDSEFVENSSLFDEWNSFSFLQGTVEKMASETRNVEIFKDAIDGSQNFFDNFSEDVDKTAVFSAMQGPTEEDIVRGETETLGSEVKESRKDGRTSVPSLAGREDETDSMAADGEEDGRKHDQKLLPDPEQNLLPLVEGRNNLRHHLGEVKDDEFSEMKSEEGSLMEDRAIGDSDTGLIAGSNLTESIQSKQDLSSASLQFAVSDLSKSFTDQKPQRLEAESFVSMTQPSVLSVSDSVRFSEPLSFDLDASTLNSDSDKLVLQSDDANSKSSDLKLESTIQGPVFQDSKYESEAHTTDPSASGSLLIKTEPAYVEMHSCSDKSQSNDQSLTVNDRRSGTINNVTSSMSNATDVSPGQPTDARLVNGNKREIETEATPKSNFHLPKHLSVEKDDAMVASGPTLLLPEEVLKQFRHHSRDDLIHIVLDQRRMLREKDVKIQDLESYIDNLLVKIIDLQPRLLMTNSSNSTGSATGVSSTESGKTAFPSSGTHPSDPKTFNTYATYKTSSDTASGVTVFTPPKSTTQKKPGFRNPFKSKQ